MGARVCVCEEQGWEHRRRLTFALFSHMTLVLMNEIRLLLDQILGLKMADPEYPIEKSPVTNFIVQLLGTSAK